MRCSDLRGSGEGGLDSLAESFVWKLSMFWRSVLVILVILPAFWIPWSYPFS